MSTRRRPSSTRSIGRSEEAVDPARRAHGARGRADAVRRPHQAATVAADRPCHRGRLPVHLGETSHDRGPGPGRAGPEGAPGGSHRQRRAPGDSRRRPPSPSASTTSAAPAVGVPDCSTTSFVDSGGHSMLERRYLGLVPRGRPAPGRRRRSSTGTGGTTFARVDFLFEPFGVVVEVSGRLGHRGAAEHDRMPSAATGPPGRRSDGLRVHVRRHHGGTPAMVGRAR